MVGPPVVDQYRIFLGDRPALRRESRGLFIPLALLPTATPDRRADRSLDEPFAAQAGQPLRQGLDRGVVRVTDGDDEVILRYGQTNLVSSNLP